LLRHLGPQDAGITAIALTPSGEFLVTGDQTGRIQVWSLAANQPSHTYAQHTAAIRELAIAPDGTTFASSSDDHTLGLWDVQQGLRAQMRELEPEPGGAIAWAAPHTLISGNADGLLQFWQSAAATA
jgi:WD40 repeat protein